MKWGLAMKIKFIWNEKGLTIVEVVMVSGLLLLLVAAVQMVLGNLLGTQRHIEQKSSSIYLYNEMYETLSSTTACTETFRDLELGDLQTLQGAEEYQPGREITVNRIMGNDSPPTTAYEVHSLGGKTYDNGALGIDSMTLYHYKPARLTGSERYNGRAKLMVKYKKLGGNAGPELRPKEFALAFQMKRDKPSGGLVEDNGHNGKLHNCSIMGAGNNPVLETAIARRSGIALSGVNCSQPVQPEDTAGVAPGSCADTNDNKVCDTLLPDMRRLATTPHPWSIPTHEHHPKYASLMLAPPSTTLSGNAGRCPVTVVDKPAGTEADDIFYMYDGTGTSGIGCKNDNGWIMSSCMLANWGLGGDSDTNIINDGRGPRCTSNDFVQPHVDQAWDVKRVSITIICSRVLKEQ